MAGMKASAVREILKVTQRPEVISFAGGLPAPELFPVDEISKVAQEVCAEEGRKVLQYATTEGRPTLRQKIADRMNKIYNSDLKMENILITTGSQQNLDMAGKIFLNPGDVVLMEAPTYLAAINAFKAYECTFKEVPTDDKGMIPEALEKILETTENVKLVYVITDFQNPTGICWPMERRKAFMEIMAKYDIPVLEDNPYGELRYEGTTNPSLLSMDQRGQVRSWAWAPSPRHSAQACVSAGWPAPRISCLSSSRSSKVRTFIRPLLIRPSLTAIWTNSALMNM